MDGTKDVIFSVLLVHVYCKCLILYVVELRSGFLWLLVTVIVSATANASLAVCYKAGVSLHIGVL